MFFIGEGIFYPLFGAGYIINIEEKEIYDTIKKYYIIKLISNGMLVMIPVDSYDSKRLRKIIDEGDYEKLINILIADHGELPLKWAERFRLYNQAIREGNIFNLAEILRDIHNLSIKKEISKSDMKVFDDILCMIASEVSIIIETEFQETKYIILDMLQK